MIRFVRSTLLATAGLLVVTTSCNVERPVAPIRSKAISSTGANALTPPAIVISQVYGGGGNSNAILKNDFVELFNPGTVSVSVAGWSVQQASATGSTWNVTTL